MEVVVKFSKEEVARALILHAQARNDAEFNTATLQEDGSYLVTLNPPAQGEKPIKPKRVWWKFSGKTRNNSPSRALAIPQESFYAPQ